MKMAKTDFFYLKLKRLVGMTFSFCILSSCSHTPPQSVAGSEGSEGVYRLDKIKVSESIQKIKQTNDDNERKLLSGELYFKALDYSLMLNFEHSTFLYSSILELYPNEKSVEEKLAIDLIQMGKHVEAKIIIEKLYKETKGKNEVIGLLMGGIYTALDEKDNALKIYKEVYSDYPNGVEACVFLAKIHLVQENKIDAKKVLNECDKKNKFESIFTYLLGKIEL
jgi:tetratricopeptide (TPR) repeat protein